MAGLTIGSYALGKRADTHAHPLRLFAYCEMGIGLSALLVMLGLNQLSPIYIFISRLCGESFVMLSLARFLVAFAILLIPTTLMGATLPTLSRFVINRMTQAGGTLAALYGINTIGAVSGCLLAGFFLIKTLGITHTTYLTAALNILIGLVAWMLALKASPVTTDEKLDEQQRTPPDDSQRRLHRLFLWCVALSGATAFIYEVYWTRALVNIIGSSTYALVTMLSAFLSGIAIGSFVVRLIIDRLKHPLRIFAWIQVGIGLSAALSMPILLWQLRPDSALAGLIGHNLRTQSDFLLPFGLCFAAMLIPAVLIGMTFPLVGRIILRDLSHTSADIGKAYAINTLGNVIGALLPGFVMLHLFGIHKGICLAALLNLGIGALLLSRGEAQFHRPRLILSITGLALLLTLLLSTPVTLQFPAQGLSSNDKVLFYREGPAVTTMVFEDKVSGHTQIAVDGISIGGTSPKVDVKQQWLAHLPKLLISDYTTEMSVGLGSGILAGESAQHAQLENITCIEIAPGVVEGAVFFKTMNHEALESTRITIVTDDAVNVLAASQEQYDIISTDGKTEPGFSINGTFFSREYYSLMKDRLAPGGLAIQWIPLHYPPRIFNSVLKTFIDVFPHATLWQANGNCFLVGSLNDIYLDPNAIEARFKKEPAAFNGIQKYGITTADSLLMHVIAKEDTLKEHLAEAEVNTLERPIIEFHDNGEFSGPIDQRELDNLNFILKVRGTGAIPFWLKTLRPETRAAYEAETAYLLGEKAILTHQAAEIFEAYFDRALTLSPKNEALRYRISGHYLGSARHFTHQQEIETASQYITKAIAIWPKDVEARLLYGRLLIDSGKVAEAVEQFELAASLDPARSSIRHLLAKTYTGLGRIDKTIAHLQAALVLNPNDVTSLYTLGYLLGELKQYSDALPLLKKAYEKAPQDPKVIHAYSWVLHTSGDTDSARTIVRKGGRYYTTAEEMKQARESILTD